MLLQGFSFGIANNIYHIPIVLKLYDLPQFANDAFIQSLRHFVSFIYFLMALVATPGNVEHLFLFAHLLTRALNIGAATIIALTLGLRDWKSIGLFIVFITFGMAFYGTSPVGLDGLWIDYFSHTELAQAVALLALCCAVRDRFWPAAALWGIAFDLNAFVGAWCVLPIAALAIDFARRRGAVALRPLLIAAILAIAIIIPDVVWIWNTVKGERVDFSYRAFLRNFEQHHFMIDAASWDALLRFTTIVSTGVLGLWLLASPRWRAVYAMFGLVFLAGCAAPFLTGSALILNLHLLRVDGLIQFLAAAFAIAALIVEALADRSLSERAIIASLGLVYVLAGTWDLILLALAVVLACRRDRYGVAVAVLVSLGIASEFLIGAHASAPLWGAGRLIAVAAFGLAIYAGSLVQSLPVYVMGLMLLSGINPWFGAAAALLVAASVVARAPRIKPAAWLLIIVAAVLLSQSVGHGSLTGTNGLTLATAAFIGAGAWWLARLQRLRTAALVLGCAALLLLRAGGGDFQGPAPVAAGVPSDDQLESFEPAAPEWREVQLWARDNTDPRALFLVPPALSGFEQGALRRAWVVDREGAAVMWEPQFFHEWWARENDVRRLDDFTAMIAYACENNINFIVLDKRPHARERAPAAARPLFDRVAVTPTATASPVFRNRFFDVFAVAPCVPPQP